MLHTTFSRALFFFLLLSHTLRSDWGFLTWTLLRSHFPLISQQQTRPVLPSTHAPPVHWLIISPHWCDCHAIQTVRAKTCNFLIFITSFLCNTECHVFADCLTKAALIDCIHFVVWHDGVILPCCFFLLVRGCFGLQGSSSWGNTARRGINWLELACVNWNVFISVMDSCIDVICNYSRFLLRHW